MTCTFSLSLIIHKTPTQFYNILTIRRIRIVPISAISRWRAAKSTGISKRIRTDTSVFLPVRTGLFPFCTNSVDFRKELGEFFCPVAYYLWLIIIVRNTKLINTLRARNYKNCCPLVWKIKLLFIVIKNRTINSLIFAFFIDVCEITHNLNSRHMSASVINNTFWSIFDEKFQ